jgi:hypothetical protein
LATRVARYFHMLQRLMCCLCGFPFFYNQHNLVHLHNNVLQCHLKEIDFPHSMHSLWAVCPFH